MVEWTTPWSTSEEREGNRGGEWVAYWERREACTYCTSLPAPWREPPRLDRELIPRMDTKHTSEILKQLENQNERLVESYHAMFHELHILQVEEEMLMRKLYELMSAEGLLSKAQMDSSRRSTPDIEASHISS